jgi:hypothetical protein
MKHIAALLATIIFTSCSHYYYVPNTHNVPQLMEKDQVNLAGNISVGEESHSLEFQSAYALKEEFGLMLNFMSSANNFNSRNTQGFLIEGGAGLFKSSSRFYVAEVFAGTGFSNQKHKYFINGTHFSSNLSFIRSFIQGDIGISDNIFDLVFSNRFCHVGFTDISSSLLPGNNEFMRLQTVRPGSFLLIEPALTLRIGFKYINLNFQIGGSYCLNASPAFEQNHISAGLSFCLANRFNRKIAAKN